MNFFSYFFSDKIALSMYSAQPVSETENPEVYRRVGPIVRSLAQRMGLPMPKLWVIPEQSPNAFATGRNPAHASVAFTSRHSATDERQRDGRRDGPRAGARAAPRHPDQLGGGHDRRLRSPCWRAWHSGSAASRDDDDRGGGSAIAALIHADSGAHRGHADPDGDFALARVSMPTPRRPNTSARPIR